MNLSINMESVTWDELCDNVLRRMSAYVEPFLTPIRKFKVEDDVKPHGTGSYIEDLNNRFLITNDHVAKHKLANRLTNSFHQNETIFITTNKFVGLEAPVDVALCQIDSSLWDKEASQARAIPLSYFAAKHETVQNELLFFAGFSGQRANEGFGTLVSRGTPYLTQECPLPDSVKEASADYHLAIPYSSEQVRTLDHSVPLPDPHGFSGSLLWNTKRLECLQSEVDWDPSMATVTGIIWGWPSSAACILATKVEHLELKEIIGEYEAL